jgi:hypothetical protein
MLFGMVTPDLSVLWSVELVEFRTNRGIIETQMTPEQIADAMKRAKVCMSSDYQDCE